MKPVGDDPRRFP